MDTPKEIINELLVEVFNHILSIEAEALRKRGIKLSMNEIHVLEAIEKTAEPTMSHLAKRLRVTVGTLTTAMNRLVEKGYVTRYRLEEDKRKVYIALTDKAIKALRIHDEFHEEMIEATIADMKLDEDEVLLQSLKNISEYFKRKY
ncbi:MarR family winged helix-turn-helix transcriptional regulator [Candidatus Xianfuyuplasma coldseepsis]|uniref:MarR family transcriptional regulator n=1 Tax=Candidatus Xianfuyuplasma coldseepsis TaxID=2782163 RepID=A0A7L7KP92_9MOLU|nr:MarR family transcriptional regulator [Xianfuyuplasma coldseepsis]QMS84477.1 MarR family transcriptional regulator [Xianfuyuplasma coldseepsis]